MKKRPLTVKELDVQPISDEDLQEFAVFAAADTGTSEVIECRPDCPRSDGGWCVDINA